MKEGTLYKTLTLCDYTFEILYGYYEDYERQSTFGEPTPIYPDFKKDPIYTKEGRPFVTKMQALCENGTSGFDDGCCADCPHYVHGEDLVGICGCEKNRRQA